MEKFEQLIAYVRAWEYLDGTKPCNENEFYYEFLKLIRNYPDDREVDFDGDGSYFGKQIRLRPFSTFDNTPRELHLEVSYCKEKISVYSAKHMGFWYPEYLNYDSSMPGFITLHGELTDFLKRVFGI